MRRRSSDKAGRSGWRGVDDPAYDGRVDTSMLSGPYRNAQHSHSHSHLHSHSQAPSDGAAGCSNAFPAFLHVNLVKAVAALCAAQGLLLFFTFVNCGTCKLWVQAAGEAKQRVGRTLRGTSRFSKAGSSGQWQQRVGVLVPEQIIPGYRDTATLVCVCVACFSECTVRQEEAIKSS